MAETDIITSKAASPIGNVITCLKIIFVNRASALILGMSLNEIKGKSVNSVQIHEHILVIAE
jgi:hypothetical protein